MFNHSVFKSLLFFGAGAVLNATGERDMEHLGGLIHRMPQTAFVFLVGCVAISALPPLNGFVSEWLTFQAILLSPQLPSWGLKFLVPAVGALLALSAALAAACFVKAFGVSFLGRAAHAAPPRDAHETDSNSLAAMFFLAALCLVAGILPGIFIDALAPVTQGAGRRAACRIRPASNGSSIVPIAESRSSYNGLLVFIFVTLSGSIAAFAIHRLASDKLRRGAGLGLRLSRSEPGDAIHRLELRPADPPRFRHDRVPRARDRRDAAAGSTAPARLTVELHDLIWDMLTRRLPLSSATPPSDSMSCNSSPSAAISRWCSRRWCCCCWCSRYGRDPRFRLSGRADAAGAAAGAAAHRLRAQGEGAPAAPAGAAADAALSRSRSG